MSTQVNTNDGAVGGPHHVAVPDGRAERSAHVAPLVTAVVGADGRTERGAHASADVAAVRRAHDAADAHAHGLTHGSAVTGAYDLVPAVAGTDRTPDAGAVARAITVTIGASDGCAHRGAHDAAFISTNSAAHVRTQWSSLGAAFSSAYGAAYRCPHFDTDVATEQTTEYAADAGAFGRAVVDAIVNADH